MILNEWFQKPLGRAVSESIQKQFEVSETSVYGECLQIGVNEIILQDKRKNYLKETHILMPKKGLGGDVVGNLDELPFDNQSFSMVFLPFTLEDMADISGLLDEIKRVLTANGYLLIVGINPWSLWGLADVLKISTNIPCKHRRSSLGIYSAVSSRGFKVHWIKSFFYRPPFSSAKLLKKSRFLEPVGQMFWPYPGGLYLLLAQKWTPQFLSVEPLWKAGGYIFGKA